MQTTTVSYTMSIFETTVVNGNERGFSRSIVD